MYVYACIDWLSCCRVLIFGLVSFLIRLRSWLSCFCALSTLSTHFKTKCTSSDSILSRELTDSVRILSRPKRFSRFLFQQYFDCLDPYLADLNFNVIFEFPFTHSLYFKKMNIDTFWDNAHNLLIVTVYTYVVFPPFFFFFSYWRNNYFSKAPRNGQTFSGPFDISASKCRLWA